MGDTTERLLWYALQVRQKQERTVCTLLSDKGYVSYAPTYKSTVLFPGYVFCCFDYEARDRVRNGGSVVTTPGVIRILGGIYPTPIPAEEMEAIRLGLAVSLKPEPWPFQCGQKVKIDSGPLKGISGIVIRSDGKQRLVLSIDLLQRSVAATIEAEWLYPAAAISQTVKNARFCLRQQQNLSDRPVVYPANAI